MRRGSPAGILAAIAGVLVLLDTALWVLSAGAQADVTVLTQAVFPSLLLLSGFAALCAARIVREAPRWAALLCAAAIVPVTVIHLAPPIAYLRAAAELPAGDAGARRLHSSAPHVVRDRRAARREHRPRRAPTPTFRGTGDHRIPGDRRAAVTQRAHRSSFDFWSLWGLSVRGDHATPQTPTAGSAMSVGMTA
jgi:hypothetical protein